LVAEGDAAAVKAALGDRHYRVVAKAAKLAADESLNELMPELMAAYRRFLDNPVKSDPNCVAKEAIVRALVQLECDDAEFFRRGIVYRQHEPVWGGTTDTAVEVRVGCAMGLVATGHPRAPVELAELLADPEARVRAGAARAIACGEAREAELLLRAKVLLGDADPGVIGECFAGLLAVAPDESPAFVARYLTDGAEVVRELAALALGGSRSPDALRHLRAAWDEELPSSAFRTVLIGAVAMHRSEAAVDWLLTVIESADVALAAETLGELAAHKRNPKLAQRLAEVVAKRDDVSLREAFARLWQTTDPADPL
jgi:HEAT repeat protein